MVALVDCQSFYASCETVFRPDLAGKPIVVLSNNDHWIIALNREAKELGLKRGLRFREAEGIIRRENVAFFSSNYTLYNDISIRVMETLREFSGRVEIYSIDEAFVHLGPDAADLGALGREIRSRVLRQTLIPTTIGVASTKALAKAAQRVAKKAGGVLVLRSEREIEGVLEATPIGDVWGIGRAYAGKLSLMGIDTALDFVNMPEWKVNKIMTVVGWRLQRELKGVPMGDLKVEASPRKGIISARQFGHKLTDLDQIEEALSQYVETAVGKLRSQNCLTGLLSVSLEASSSFHGGGQQAHREFPPTDYLPFLLKTSKELLRSLYVKGKSYWRTTVFLFGIVPRDGLQGSLFVPNRRNPRESAIMEVMDRINHRYGSRTIHSLASQASDDWGMRREHLSPRYTSRFAEFPEIPADGADGPGGLSPDAGFPLPGDGSEEKGRNHVLSLGS